MIDGVTSRVALDAVRREGTAALANNTSKIAHQMQAQTDEDKVNLPRRQQDLTGGGRFSRCSPIGGWRCTQTVVG